MSLVSRQKASKERCNKFMSVTVLLLHRIVLTTISSLPHDKHGSALRARMRQNYLNPRVIFKRSRNILEHKDDLTNDKYNTSSKEQNIIPKVKSFKIVLYPVLGSTMNSFFRVE